ncbi:MAG: glycosyltransferase family 2 protein [Bacteroidota bacterium]
MLKIHIAIPILDELDYIENTIACINKQSYTEFQIYICVNQPDFWWEGERIEKCLNNQKTIEWLRSNHPTIIIIDKSSKGNGWKDKDHGVGWARKILMDKIAESTTESDIIVSLDADTEISDNYLESIITAFNDNPNALALSNPYYHKLTKNVNSNIAVLRYEIYMRCYAINMMLIKSPYAFTALGSAISFPIKSYKMIKGIAPKKSGEDFYFLQRLRKTGNLLVWNSSTVFPASRFSNRVFFGTGPAMIKGNNGDWSSYPIYHFSLFENINKTYKCFHQLFTEDINTPLDDFFKETFGEENIWKPLRTNFKTLKNFINACHNKFDGLRVLQYVKTNQAKTGLTDEICLYENLKYFFNKEIIDKSFKFDESNVLELNKIRDILFEKEQELQKSCKII